MSTGFENYWLGQPGTQEPPNLPKTNSARNSMLTVNYNNYKSVPNQTQHVLRTGYSEYVNNCIPPHNTTSSNPKVMGNQNRLQPHQVYWPSSAVDNPHPARLQIGHSYPQQELVPPQGKNLQYLSQNSQPPPSSYYGKQLNNPDVAYSHFYFGNFNNNNNNNSNNNCNNNSFSHNLGNGNSGRKMARIRVKDVFSLNNSPTTEIAGNNFYGSPRQEHYTCPLNYLPVDNGKETTPTSQYQNGNCLPSYTNLSHNIPDQYEFGPSSRQNPNQLKSFQQHNTPIALGGQFHFNGAAVSQNGPVPSAPIAVHNNNNANSNPRMGERVEVDARRIVSGPLHCSNKTMNIPENYFINGQALSNPEVNRNPSKSSGNTNNSNGLGNTNDIVGTQPRLSLPLLSDLDELIDHTINYVLNEEETAQTIDVPDVVSNRKRSSDSVSEYPKSKMFKEDESIVVIENEIKIENEGCGTDLDNAELNTPNIEENQTEKFQENNSPENERQPQKYFLDLTEKDIEKSTFFPKKRKRKTKPKALETTKTPTEHFANSQEKRDEDLFDNQEKIEGEKLSEIEEVECETKINREKLDRLKEYITSLKSDETINTNSENTCKENARRDLHKEKNEGLNRRRKLSKGSIVKNKNTSREMISLMSYKSPKVEISKCSPGDKETKADTSVKNSEIGECESEINNKNKQEPVADSVVQNKSKPKNAILTSPKKRDSFEETAIINTMRAFQNLEYHYCMSCDLVSSNSSFWINVVSAELRCVNCFKKMALQSDKSKSKESNKMSSDEDECSEKVQNISENIVSEVPSKRSRKEVPDSGEIDLTEKPKRRKTSFDEETQRTVERRNSEERKKKETDSLSKPRKMSIEECGMQKMRTSEKCSKNETKQILESTNSCRRKSFIKDEGGKTHISEENLTKQTADAFDRAKRKSISKDESANISEERTKKEKLKRKGFGEEIIQKGQNSEKDLKTMGILWDKPKKKKEEVTSQEVQHTKESNNGIRKSLENNEKDEKLRKHSFEKDTKTSLKKLNDHEERSGDREHKKVKSKEKENPEKKESKWHEKRKEHKNSTGKLLKGHEIKLEVVEEESANEKHPKENSTGAGGHVPRDKRHSWSGTNCSMQKKNKLPSTKFKDSESDGKNESSVLFAQLLKKTRKLSKSLLGET